MSSSAPRLYERSGEAFRLPHHVDVHGVAVEAPAENIPVLHWPDGRICFEASLFMLDLYGRGLSRLVGGGTLFTYATKVSHLIRFCHKNEVAFASLTDNYFTLFINGLRAELRPNGGGQRVRTNTTVISIGRVCLDFLSTVAELNARDDLVGEHGAIRATRKETSIAVARGLKVRYWDHASFGSDEVHKERLPISSGAIRRLRRAILDVRSSTFVRRRRQVMLKLLEITGGRRTEIALLQVQDVLEASRLQHPMLRLRNLKRRRGRVESRLLPVSRHDIDYLCEYIEYSRSSLIRKTCGAARDKGMLLVSESSGFGLKPNTITQEVRFLRVQAELIEQICAHMFRHRFITKLFVALLEQHRFENEDAFRQALIDQEMLKTKLLQWTGQTSISSLDRYIHLAFEEVARFKNTYSLVLARQALSSFLGSLEEIGLALARGAKVESARVQLVKLIQAIASDLDRLAEPEEVHV